MKSSRIGMFAAALVAAVSLSACGWSKMGGAADDGGRWGQITRSIPNVIALALILTLILTVPAFAQDGKVTIPWGDWLNLTLANFRDLVIAGVAAFIAWVAKRLSPQVAEFILAARVEQLMARAIDYGLAAVAGAAKGKTLDVKVANEVLEKAAEYAIENAPSLVSKLGDTLRPKLLARLAPNVAPEVTAAAVSADVSS